MPFFSQPTSPTSLLYMGKRAELLGCPERRCCFMGLVEAMATGTPACPECSGARPGCSLPFYPLCITGTSVCLIQSSAEQNSAPMALLKVVPLSRSQGRQCKGRRKLAQKGHVCAFLTTQGYRPKEGICIKTWGLFPSNVYREESVFVNQTAAAFLSGLCFGGVACLLAVVLG